MQEDAVHGEAGPAHEFELAPGDDVDEPALPVEEPHERPAQERLPRVGELGARTEGGAKRGEARLEVAFVDDHERRTEAGGEVGRGDAADASPPSGFRP